MLEIAEHMYHVNTQHKSFANKGVHRIIKNIHLLTFKSRSRNGGWLGGVAVFTKWTGTKIGKNLHVINFTFVLPDEEQSLSAAGNHTIAILKIPEAYEELLLGLSDIAHEVEQLDVPHICS